MERFTVFLLMSLGLAAALPRAEMQPLAIDTLAGTKTIEKQISADPLITKIAESEIAAAQLKAKFDDARSQQLSEVDTLRGNQMRESAYGQYRTGARARSAQGAARDLVCAKANDAGRGSVTRLCVVAITAVMVATADGDQ